MLTPLRQTLVMERRVIYPSQNPASGPLLCHLRQHPLEFDPATRGRREEGRVVRCGRGDLGAVFCTNRAILSYGESVCCRFFTNQSLADSFSAFITILLKILSFIKLQQDPPATPVTHFSTFFHQIAKIQVRSTRGEDRRSRSWEEDGYNML